MENFQLTTGLHSMTNMESFQFDISRMPEPEKEEPVVKSRIQKAAVATGLLAVAIFSSMQSTSAKNTQVVKPVPLKKPESVASKPETPQQFYAPPINFGEIAAYKFPPLEEIPQKTADHWTSLASLAEKYVAIQMNRSLQIEERLEQFESLLDEMIKWKVGLPDGTKIVREKELHSYFDRLIMQIAFDIATLQKKIAALRQQLLV